MSVKDLIEALQTMPQHVPVIVDADGGECDCGGVVVVRAISRVELIRNASFCLIRANLFPDGLD